MKRKVTNHLFILFLFFAFFLSSCTTNNWSQFRGPDFNMVVIGKNLPTEWGDSLNIRWTADMDGESWSSPIIYGDKVFYSSAVLVKKAPVKIQENEPEQKQGNGDAPPPPPEDNSYLEDIYRWQISCLDLKTGNELWKKISFEGNPRIKKHAGSTYACETPVTDGKRVYVYYGMVGVYCYDSGGGLIWEKDLGAYPTLNGWGTGSSPVLYNNVLYVLVDNEENSFLVALDAVTGEEKWRKSRDEKTTYSTPVIWENGHRTELVTLGSKARSYDPESGELLWELELGGRFAIPSPVFDDEAIYFGNAGGPDAVGPLFAVKAGADGNITPAEGETTSDGVIWLVPEAGVANPSPLLYNGLIYILSSRGGEISCFDALTGNLVYKEKIDGVGACWASPWVCDNKIYFYDERGNTRVLKAGREFELVSENSIDDKFWASIAVANGAYIFKGVEKIYCIGK
ncbi:PQQ-binding-like beta-propeller repeat protein [Maribellus comscasis]|uniref:PQQ-binding-like beta-propeller repeat protein n=1 Tax=Maribellus comscasis TaxID=2681766 RepID=A0A6I6JXE7_9BACT|nr:PQQ-binding-like beta-propeller repeat protein [Maribellus comscasis]QGY44867.1 PQQ-binding-like beta-propeller repeat protein [Maribellus comscasis]